MVLSFQVILRISLHGLPYNLRTNRFGTAKMSALYTLATIKKDSSDMEESLLVSHVDITWNSFLPYLIRLADRLEDLGFRYVNDEVIVLKGETDGK